MIGESNVAVPTHLYKIVLAEKEGQQPAMGKFIFQKSNGLDLPFSYSISAGVFIVPNQPLGNEKLREFQVPLEELERHVGTTFHSKLDRSKVSTEYVIIHRATPFIWA